MYICTPNYMYALSSGLKHVQEFHLLIQVSARLTISLNPSELS